MGSRWVYVVGINRYIFSRGILYLPAACRGYGLFANDPQGESKGYKLGSAGKLVNHLLFMDDVKLYASSQRELESLVNVVEAYSWDIGMEFVMDKCAVLTVKDGKRVVGEGLELPCGELVQVVGENGYKYLGVLQADKMMSRKLKAKVKVEYLCRVKLLVKLKLYAGNLMRGVLSVW